MGNTCTLKSVSHQLMFNILLFGICKQTDLVKHKTSNSQFIDPYYSVQLQ